MDFMIATSLFMFIYILTTVICDPKEDSGKVEVRAVFIDCMLDQTQSVTSENELARFQRQELFKHNALQNCDKKLTLTIKLTSVPNQEIEDEFIAIEHVIEGPKKTLVRLFNPYVLKLRRENPLEAYKLQKVEEVRGVFIEESDFTKKRRTRSHTHFSNDLSRLEENLPIKNCAKESCTNITWSRNKRFASFNDDNFFNDPSTQPVDQSPDLNPYPEEVYQTPVDIRRIREDSSQEIDSRNIEPEDQSLLHSSKDNFFLDGTRRDEENSREPPESDRRFEEPETDKQVDYDKDKRFSENKNKHFTKKGKSIKGAFAHKAKEKPLIIYEIKNSDVMYNLQLKLFEKLSSSGGKTVWNDLSGTVASVSSFRPEWTSEDMNVKYRASEWVQKDDFTLPSNALFLVTPMYKANDSKDDSNEAENFVVVPMEDIIEIENRTADSDSSSREHRELRKVQVRVSRAQWVDDINNFKVVHQGTDKFLTRPYKRIHRAQVDVEARADENQLIRIGSAGRIPIVVTDYTGKNHVLVTIQTTNTGLAAAVFKVATRECNPELTAISDKVKQKVAKSEPIMIPPMHTRRMRMEIPLEPSFSSGLCTVALLNDCDETVAIREVPIKNDDRCFCVWHCDCVCLGDDPKLLCKEMPITMQIAAGLTKGGPQHHRQVRSARCKSDIFSLDIIVVIVGVTLILLILGIFKAILGLCCRCIGFWGLDRIVQTPRRLNNYYEYSLRGRVVQYDAEGYPVHPDTGKRVRQISATMEFFLNVIYFLIWPFVTICDVLKYCSCSTECPGSKCGLNSSKTYFSSHDLPGGRGQWRHRRPMDSRKWMTPEAELLSGDIWNRGLDMYPGTETNPEGSMHPILLEDQCQKPAASGVGSEPDDTEYVLLQMQKSRESLAKSQKKINDSGQVSPKTPKLRLSTK